jgi:hypothetical protein
VSTFDRHPRAEPGAAITARGWRVRCAATQERHAPGRRKAGGTLQERASGRHEGLIETDMAAATLVTRSPSTTSRTYSSGW